MFLFFNTQSNRNSRNYKNDSNISDREKVAILNKTVKIKKVIIVLIGIVINGNTSNDSKIVTTVIRVRLVF
jgi:hypothetical protein